mgnify:CR=1 FL=1
MADERKHQKQALFWFTLAVLFVLAVLTLQEILLPFVAGLVIAYALNPLVDRIERLGLDRLLDRLDELDPVAALIARGKPPISRSCEVPEFTHACLGGVYGMKGAINVGRAVDKVDGSIGWGLE